MKPSPGRIVLYRGLDGDTYVAIVSRVREHCGIDHDETRATLVVFFDDADAPHVRREGPVPCVPTVLQDVVEGTDPGTWSWPPRVS